MKLADFVCFDAVVAELKAGDRDGAIHELVTALHKAGKLGQGDPDQIARAVIEREKEASTGAGIDFSALDKQPVYSVILLLSPIENADMHLQLMECIFRNLQKEDFRRFLRQAQTVEQIKETIQEADVSEK